MSNLLKISLAANAALCILAALLVFKSSRESRINLTENPPQASISVVEQSPVASPVSHSDNPPSAVEQSPVAKPDLHARWNQDHASVSVPLALQSIDAAALNLTADQVTTLLELRESFLTAIGGPGQDTNNPDYRDRWLKAQADSDDAVRGLLGIQTWLAIESQTGTGQTN